MTVIEMKTMETLCSCLPRIAKALETIAKGIEGGKKADDNADAEGDVRP